MPLISVIVPVYKVEPYLERCVNSIINQTYKNLEIILVDDGSPDNCGKICDELAIKDNRIRVIHKENGGLSSARNAGLDIATGDYITFVDSDDYIENDYLFYLLNALINSNSDIAICGMKTIDESEKIISIDAFLSNEIFNVKEIFEKILLPLKTAAWGKLFSKKIISNYRFPEKIIHGEDLVFLANLIENDTKFITVKHAFYFYLKRKNSITTAKFSKKSFDEVYCKDIAYSILKEKFPEYSEKAISWCAKARLNLIRKITISNPDKYSDKIKEYKNWLFKNKKKFFKFLPIKFKIEYYLLKNHRLYLIVTKLYKRFDK